MLKSNKMYSEGTLLFDLTEQETFFYEEERNGEEVKLAPSNFRLATKEEFEKHPPKVRLTLEQAIDCLSTDHYIHTFVDLIYKNSIIMLGADTKREHLIDELTKFKDTLCIGGPACRGMNHGLIYIDQRGPVFVAANEEKLKEYDIIPNF